MISKISNQMNDLEGLCVTVERGNREKFVCEAQDAIFFKFCENEDDLHSADENTFQPEYTHQVFLILILFHTYFTSVVPTTL